MRRTTLLLACALAMASAFTLALLSTAAGTLAPAAGTFPVDLERPIGRPYGVSLHWPHSENLESIDAPEATSFAACEFGWARTCNFVWSIVEPAPGDFSPLTEPAHYSNRFLAAVSSVGSRVLPLIDGPPGWLGDGPHPYVSPGHVPLLCNYVNRTVTQYQNNMSKWELFNEPNNGWGKDYGTWDEFLAVLIATAETIKRVNSSLDVIVGGLGGTRELEFLDYIVANLTATATSVPGFDTARELFSGIAFHPYSSPAEELVKKLSEYDEILARYQWTIKDGARHWITEIGGETDSPRDGAGGFLVDPQREYAAMMAKQIAIATSWGVEGFNIWTYRDFEPPGSYSAEFGHCGIVYSDASWKGVTHACNWTNRFIGNGHSMLLPVAFPSPLTGIVARDGVLVGGKERWAIVVWNPAHQGAVDARIGFGTGLSRAVAHDYASNGTNELDVQAGATWIDIQVGYEPTLLVVDCIPGGNCVLSVQADVLGGAIVVLVVASAALLVGVACLSLRRARATGYG
ncbi:MAG: hypothetical protein JW839_10755 [Candidatus Lokiarchaeota archaeon]|nr:hypothetical protein [Candidatus Lokiarchaeota archaeon]